MARLHAPPLASLMMFALLLPPEAVAFVPSASNLQVPSVRQSSGLVPSAVTTSSRGVRANRAAAAGRSSGRRSGPQPLLASSKPDVKDTSSVIAEMEGWTKVVTFGTHISRNTKYIVSDGTTLPEVLFDFWRVISDCIDEHRATREDRSLVKLIMFVAPFCEELRDYETMEHTDQLLQQSAREGGCQDFGTAITHSHYHPNYRHRPKPRQPRMASRHSPHPAFSIDVVYGKGGLKTLASARAAAEAQGASRSHPLPPAAAAAASAASPRLRKGSPEQKKAELARKKKEEWAAKTRSSLEHAYGMAASYGKEEAASSTRAHQHQHALAGRGVPESSQEIMHDTQAWLKGVLEEAAESDSAAAAAAASLAAAAAAGGNTENASTPSTGASSSSSAADDTIRPSGPLSSAAALSAKNGAALFSHAGGAGATAAGRLDTERSTAFSPPTASEAMAAAAAAALDEEAASGARAAKMSRAMTSGDAARHGSSGGGGDKYEGQSTKPHHHTPSVRFRAAAGGLKHVFTHAAERVTVQRGGGGGGNLRVADSSSSSNPVGQKETAPKIEGEEIDSSDAQKAGASIGKQQAPVAAAATAAVQVKGQAVGVPAGPLEAALQPLPGKELVKRMKDISQYIVARSKTTEEAYSDVWEVIMEMADRAANRGCNVPTEDYSSTSMPCYGALLVTPDLATYSSQAFFRFQETLNRGLKHLPMEHDISVEAFHPEAVSEATPLDHRFTRSPFPTLHVCYHGLRDTEDGDAVAPAAATAASKKSNEGRAAGSNASREGSARPSGGVGNAGEGKEEADQ